MNPDALTPFLEHRLIDWRGLSELSPGDLIARFGEPGEQLPSELGCYPAERLVFPLETASGGLAAFVRADCVVLIEAIRPPSLEATRGLPEPSAILAHEILVPGAYAHEHLFCERGLVLTVARPLRGEGPDRIVRCRGVRPLANAAEYGPEYYRAFEDRISW